MAQTVFANCRGIAHAGSSGKSPIFPDVCKTPSPGGPVPVPYPNLANASDTSSGPSTVTCDGSMPMVKGANYSTSTGDEAGTIGGVKSSTTKGKAELLMYSFDVKFEGKNVGRLGDTLTHNNQNALG